MSRQFPKAEQIGLGDRLVKLSTIAFEQLSRYGMALCAMDPNKVGPITERQSRAAEFARVETLLADPVERENFVHSQPS